MTLNLILLGVFVAVTFALWREGTWSAIIMLLDVLLAATLATAWYPAVVGRLQPMFASYTYLLDFLALEGLFCLLVLAFREVTDRILRTRVKFRRPVEMVGGPLVAALTAWVMVCFTATALHTAPVPRAFVQDNHSKSAAGVLRGLHYQLPPHPQGKLVRVVRGRVWDVAVDIRAGSATFGRWVGAHLSAHNKHQLWVPPGFAHGFVVLSEVAEFLYKTTDYYAPAHERCIAWNDADLAIEWPLDSAPQLSAKDAAGVPLASAEVFP